MGYIFVHAEPVIHDIYGECRMELWQVVQPAPENVAQQSLPAYHPQYITRFYKRSTLVETTEED